MATDINPLAFSLAQDNGIPAGTCDCGCEFHDSNERLSASGLSGLVRQEYECGNFFCHLLFYTQDLNHHYSQPETERERDVKSIATQEATLWFFGSSIPPIIKIPDPLPLHRFGSSPHSNLQSKSRIRFLSMAETLDTELFEHIVTAILLPLQQIRNHFHTGNWNDRTCAHDINQFAFPPIRVQSEPSPRISNQNAAGKCHYRNSGCSRVWS